MLMLVGCQTTNVAVFGCPKVRILNQIDRPWNKTDKEVLASGKTKCDKNRSVKGNDNVCLLSMTRHPNYHYYMLCGLEKPLKEQE